MNKPYSALAYASAIVANYVGLWYESGAGVQFYELPWNPTSEILVLISRPYFQEACWDYWNFYWGSILWFSGWQDYVWAKGFSLLKYQSAFDIVPVLVYVLPLHTASISLQLLLFKASFLTVIPLFFREAARLALDCLSWSREIVWSCILSPQRNRRELGMCEATSRFWIFLRICICPTITHSQHFFATVVI